MGIIYRSVQLLCLYISLHCPKQEVLRTSGLLPKVATCINITACTHLNYENIFCHLDMPLKKYFMILVIIYYDDKIVH